MSNPTPESMPPATEATSIDETSVELSVLDNPAVSDQAAFHEIRGRIRKLPPEVGMVLIAAGVMGVILPGPLGTPLLLAGGLVLSPTLFGRAELWAERRFPTAHRHGMRYVDRFIDDFERRFPAGKPTN
jgi:hypothetical protein